MDKLDMIYNDVKYVREKIDAHLEDHEGVDLKKLNTRVDRLDKKIIYATGGLTVIFGMLVYLKEAILAWIGRS